jgi:hypothetical protein
MSGRSCRSLGSHPREQECFYLRLHAETFAYELRREMQVRSEGGPWLLQEWVVALERERQEILDTILKIEQVQDEECSLLSVYPSVGVPFRGISDSSLRPNHPTTASVPHTDVTFPNNRQNSTSRSDTASRSSFSTNNIPSPSQRRDFFHHPAFDEIDGVLVAILLLCHA